MSDWPLAQGLLGLALLFLFAILLHFIVRRTVLRALRELIKRTETKLDDYIIQHNTLGYLFHVVPSAVIQFGVQYVPNVPADLATVVRNVALAYTILMVMLAISAFLKAVNDIYEHRPENRARPIKGYLQLIKIVLTVVAVILIIATLIERSPLLLLSGMGALTAVLMLVFKDTILSFVAGIQIASHDMVRVGDWIEMPQLGADGDVVEIALHTVKVQNWDRTITTIPTWRLVGESFRNWRGMTESGGRRIKRALHIDQGSIHFLTPAELQHLERFELLRDYLAMKRQELADWNARYSGDINQRRLTNIGTFRAYVTQYLKSHPGVHQGMILMVRQLPPGPQGLPLEIYCFSADTAWVAHESLAGDIFDHLLSIVGEFGLSMYQSPSGRDLARLSLTVTLPAEGRG
ncbi:MAG TPA: mechanosensitive ion channel family protein [Xanthomonadaceae bacterium]|nr:mechanosensitive ion channel family protein [Xanthomonadaceae bacterium]